MAGTQMAMTPNFVWIATDDTESDYLEYRQWEQEEVIKAEDLEWHDYRHFKRVVKSYAKILGDVYLEQYWHQKLREVIYSQHLLDNKLIMSDPELIPFINKLK